MKKNSTNSTLKVNDKGKCNLFAEKDTGPKLQTIDFLQRFARVYHAEPVWMQR